MLTTSSTITAEDTWTLRFSPPSNPHQNNVGYFTLSISGTFTATITLQRSFDSGETWQDVETFTGAEEVNLFDATLGVLYRVGVKEGDFTSGSIAITLAK